MVKELLSEEVRISRMNLISYILSGYPEHDCGFPQAR
jgi:hypothetical protein